MFCETAWSNFTKLITKLQIIMIPLMTISYQTCRRPRPVVFKGEINYSTYNKSSAYGRSTARSFICTLRSLDVNDSDKAIIAGVSLNNFGKGPERGNCSIFINDDNVILDGMATLAILIQCGEIFGWPSTPKVAN